MGVLPEWRRVAAARAVSSKDPAAAWTAAVLIR
jgi:hypothetical protein